MKLNIKSRRIASRGLTLRLVMKDMMTLCRIKRNLLFCTLLFWGCTNKIPHDYPKDDDAAKRSAERKLTNEARTEGKLACPLPCKEEEDEVNDRSNRVCGVSVRTVSLIRHSPADKSVIWSGRRRSGTAHRHRGSRVGKSLQAMKRFT